MYDWPRGTTVTNHFPITWATAIVEKRSYLRINEESLAKAGPKISGLREMAGLKDADPSKPMSQVIVETLAASKDQVDAIRQLKDSELDDSLRNILRAADELTLLDKNSRALKAEMDQA